MADAKEVQGDKWSHEKYQEAAAFVPKLATKVVQWLDVQPTDRILDIGCGDGVLTCQIAQNLVSPGSILGIDASESMIASATIKYSTPCTSYTVLDATKLEAALASSELPDLSPARFSKVFSNAALHWILRNPTTRLSVFTSIHKALAPAGKLCFEMGGMGNVAEMRTALLFAIAKRRDIATARAADPWFFPDGDWMREMLEGTGFRIDRMEFEYRPTPATETGGMEAWVRLMGRQFLEVLDGGVERDDAVREVVETLETVCGTPAGKVVFGYVRLRVLATKI